MLTSTFTSVHLNLMITQTDPDFRKHLKRIYHASHKCRNSSLTDEAAKNAAHHFPSLEDVVLRASPWLTDDSVVAFLYACPNLQTLSMDRRPFWHGQVTERTLIDLVEHPNLGRKLTRLSL